MVRFPLSGEINSGGWVGQAVVNCRHAVDFAAQPEATVSMRHSYRVDGSRPPYGNEFPDRVAITLEQPLPTTPRKTL